MKKQTKSKKAGSPRKAPKPATKKEPAAAPAPKPRRTKERDPRLPAAGTTIVRKDKGREIRVKVLEDGFECEGAEFRSLSALAAKITEAGAINGYLFFHLTGPKAAAPKTETAEKPAAPAKARAPKARRAGRDPQPAAPTETAPAGEAAAA